MPQLQPRRVFLHLWISTLLKRHHQCTVYNYWHLPWKPFCSHDAVAMWLMSSRPIAAHHFTAAFAFLLLSTGPSCQSSASFADGDIRISQRGEGVDVCDYNGLPQHKAIWLCWFELGFKKKESAPPKIPDKVLKHCWTFWATQPKQIRNLHQKLRIQTFQSEGAPTSFKVRRWAVVCHLQHLRVFSFFSGVVLHDLDIVIAWGFQCPVTLQYRSWTWYNCIRSFWSLCGKWKCGAHLKSIHRPFCWNSPSAKTCIKYNQNKYNVQYGTYNTLCHWASLILSSTLQLQDRGSEALALAQQLGSMRDEVSSFTSCRFSNPCLWQWPMSPSVRVKRVWNIKAQQMYILVWPSAFVRSFGNVMFRTLDQARCTEPTWLNLSTKWAGGGVVCSIIHYWTVTGTFGIQGKIQNSSILRLS